MSRLFIKIILLLFFLHIQIAVVLAESDWKGCNSVTEIPVSECDALTALYTSTNGTEWKDNTGWLQTNTPCSWYGVSCSSGNVTRISLRKNQLIGFLPPELGTLLELQELSLNSNQLSGKIPAEWGNLSELQRLELDSNQLNGSIPEELGNLSELRSLNLLGNQLNGSIPPTLGNLPVLQSLNLCGNRLSGKIPSEFGNLSSLQSFLLSNNRLSGEIPATLGNLSRLETFWMSGNRLSGSIPASLGNLSNAQQILLDDNRLTGSIPATFGKLASLQTLDLSNNLLIGKIPQEFGKLSALNRLALHNNKLNTNISFTLTVTSSGLAGNGVQIAGKSEKYSGKTNYSVDDIKNGTVIHLTAPAIAGTWSQRKKLVSWDGCDFMFGRTCTVKMLSNKTVTVKYDAKDSKKEDSGSLFGGFIEDLKEFDEEYDARHSKSSDFCNSLEIVLKNPEKLDVRYIVSSYDPIGHSGQLLGDLDGTRIPESISIISTADALRAVEWKKYTDALLYTVIVDEKCDGSTTRQVQPIGLGGMMQEDSTSFEDMKSRITVTVTSSLSADDEKEVRLNYPD